MILFTNSFIDNSHLFSEKIHCFVHNMVNSKYSEPNCV